MESSKCIESAVLPNIPAEGSAVPEAVLIGRRMRKLRTEEGISARELARRLGVSRSTVQRYEAGGIDPGKTGLLIGISGVLGVAPTRLLTEDAPKTERPAPENELLLRMARRFLAGLEQEGLSVKESAENGADRGNPAVYPCGGGLRAGEAGKDSGGGNESGDGTAAEKNNRKSSEAFRERAGAFARRWEKEGRGK